MLGHKEERKDEVFVGNVSTVSLAIIHSKRIPFVSVYLPYISGILIVWIIYRYDLNLRGNLL